MQRNLFDAPAVDGEFRFTVQARDADNVTITRAFGLPISCKPASPAGGKR